MIPIPTPQRASFEKIIIRFGMLSSESFTLHEMSKLISKANFLEKSYCRLLKVLTHPLRFCLNLLNNVYNLHELSKPITWKIKQNSKCRLLKFFTHHAKREISCDAYIASLFISIKQSG